MFCMSVPQRTDHNSGFLIMCIPGKYLEDLGFRASPRFRTDSALVVLTLSQFSWSSLLLATGKVRR